MSCLGLLVTSKASSSRALAHRQHAAQITIAKKGNAFKCHLPYNIKMRAWLANGQASAAYGLETLHLTKELLHGMRRWEQQQVRRALCMWPREEEGPKGYRMRLSKEVKKAFQDSGIHYLHHRVMKAALKSASKQQGAGRWLREERDRNWRVVSGCDPYRRRKADETVQQRSGRRAA